MENAARLAMSAKFAPMASVRYLVKKAWLGVAPLVSTLSPTTTTAVFAVSSVNRAPFAPQACVRCLARQVKPIVLEPVSTHERIASIVASVA